VDVKLEKIKQNELGTNESKTKAIMLVVDGRKQNIDTTKQTGNKDQY